MTKTVRMEVTATVTPPRGQELSDEHVIELAMHAVTQSLEVECGREIGPAFNRIAWARVYAEVSDEDCEISE